MDTLDEIYNFVKKKKKQGYEGYQDIIEDFKKYDAEQLDYLEIAFKVSIESNKRLAAFREIVTLSVAILAIIFSVVPDELKSNANSFSLILLNILGFFVLCILVFLFLSNYPSRKIDVCTTALQIIKKIKR